MAGIFWMNRIRGKNAVQARCLLSFET